jgi:hypothetical protein
MGFAELALFCMQSSMLWNSWHWIVICLSLSAAKVSTSETSLLGSQPQYMRKLLSIVRSNVQTNCIDNTIKFTLSALWNLTGEFIIEPTNLVLKTNTVEVQWMSLVCNESAILMIIFLCTINLIMLRIVILFGFKKSTWHILPRFLHVTCNLGRGLNYLIK